MVLTAIIIIATVIACCVGFAKGFKAKKTEIPVEKPIVDAPKPEINHSVGGCHKEATEEVAYVKPRNPKTGRFIKKEETT